MGFWTFSLAVYGNTAVRRECLELQDRHGINVNLLLFCLFVGAVHRAVLSRADVKQADGVVNIWHEEVVGSLRATRRALKSSSGDASSVDFNSLYKGVKAQELAAEKFEQMMLERWCAEHVSAWSKALPSVAAERNIATLFELSPEGGPRPDLPKDLISAALQYAAKL